MTKEELILKVQKEIDYLTDEIFDDSITDEYRNHLRVMLNTISITLNDIKNLNGETVKLRETCSCDNPNKKSEIDHGLKLCRKCRKLHVQVE